jgi:hypothetical protein
VPLTVHGGIAAAVVVASLASGIARAEPPRAGTEFQVNTLTSGWQTRPAIAMDDDGDFVTAWMDSFGASRVAMRRFREDGSSRGPVVQVDPVSGRYPAIAFDGPHTFVVVWTRTDALLTEATIQARRYHENGDSLDGIVEVADHRVEPTLQFPAVAANNAGEFVVAWLRYDYSPEIFARVFDSGGAKGPEFQVNSTTGGSKLYPVAAMADDGDFVVAWWDNSGRDGDQGGVFARRFDGDGDALGADFQVNTYTPGVQWLPGAAMTAEGDFVIAWSTTGQPD